MYFNYSNKHVKMATEKTGKMCFWRILPDIL